MELKAHRIGNIISAYKIGKAFCMKTEEEVYIKSEADKVIAEKDKKIDLYKRGWEESDRINEHLYAQLRHSNYKRCLAMAGKCENGKLIYQYKQRCGDAETEIGLDYLMKRAGWYRKWQLRWLELAEKFK